MQQDNEINACNSTFLENFTNFDENLTYNLPIATIYWIYLIKFTLLRFFFDNFPVRKHINFVLQFNKMK